jgi:tRNA threonylcarbamoyl adenosine modification protein (Sua5/YciO/YrdC/YwlC family)
MRPKPRTAQQVADILKDGGIVVYPTDTVYALGCIVSNKHGLDRISQIKASVKPKSIIFADIRDISEYAKVSNEAYRLMRLLFPGPYTLILPATRHVPRLLQSKRKSIGVRIPDHWFCRELVSQIGEPIITTSIPLRTTRSTSTPSRSRPISATGWKPSWTAASCRTYPPPWCRWRPTRPRSSGTAWVPPRSSRPPRGACMKKMLINALHPEEIRVAVVDDGVLTGFHLESALKEQLRGNIYKGRISKVEHSLNAVFVDFGREKHGLLPVNDINPDLVGGVHDRKNIIASLHKGMELLVQVVREEKGAKGALLTTDISLPGRYLVLLPHQDMAGISRKIDDEKQRRRLREIIDQIKPPEGSGVIVRTAGMDRNKTELGRDMAYLTRLWKSIEEQFRSAECPSIVYKEGDIIIRTVRDYLSPDTAEILVDDEDTEKRVLSFMKTVMPKLKGIVKSYRQNRPLFTKFELEQQIEAVYGAKVRLRSGDPSSSSPPRPWWSST